MPPVVLRCGCLYISSEFPSEWVDGEFILVAREADSDMTGRVVFQFPFLTHPTRDVMHFNGNHSLPSCHLPKVMLYKHPNILRCILLVYSLDGCSHLMTR